MNTLDQGREVHHETANLPVSEQGGVWTRLIANEFIALQGAAVATATPMS